MKDLTNTFQKVQDSNLDTETKESVLDSVLREYGFEIKCEPASPDLYLEERWFCSVHRKSKINSGFEIYTVNDTNGPIAFFSFDAAYDAGVLMVEQIIQTERSLKHQVMNNFKLKDK